ncbi:MAG: hypothetical protein F2718_06350 [Actinobacteria bacterium]|uniref:Unannotated protein n=1 Tax=freshwater metagenome TaxID=449393 RepID=A0A6J6WDY2_9ZZZZ|nr:hypothetical protein [Actinomycetota bacterium]MSY27498.1 hypothetical protein [Actinomycetota bacterium]MSZ87262.1 hypothetical protein [Actinomycetota bacterium]MTB14247.1 hypothetical protein [Actinomycetota bacterium]MTB25802.1 hypothetical protein [Actinomycetota bacterium]
MKRKTFDRLLSAAGAMLSVVLIVAGGMLLWGANFANSQVNSQLKDQNVFFPEAGSPGFDAKKFPELQKYAGLQMTTGQQAKDYANFYIAAHLKGINGGKNYAETSSDALDAISKAGQAALAAEASPDDMDLIAAAEQSQVEADVLDKKVQTLFRGETLRGLLLTSFAFWQVGQIALISAYFAFAAGVVMLLLTLLGFAHLRKTPADAQI